MTRPYRTAGGADGLLRTSEVAELLQVSRETVTRWARAGKLPYRRTLGGHRRFDEAAMRALAEERTYQPPDNAGRQP